MKLLLTVAISCAASSSALAVDPNASSPQNVLIGATPAVQASANNGAGIKFGIIDTGGTTQWIGFQGFKGNKNQGKVISSTCIVSCPSSAKKTGNIDDNGHGSFVTSEIIGGVPSIGMVGVAPAANAIEIKVLNTQGSGTAAQVAQGITAAVNQGAQIINLSLGPTGAAASQAAFFQSIASAVNFAASKNVIVVFAGGNASMPLSGGANITGFTDAAIARMLFVGSTNSSLELSKFSNTPGSAGFISTSGKFVPYSLMWVMAPGENIIGASNYHTGRYGYGYITQMSGTSMAAPQAAGAAGLLASRWPFLLPAGTIPAILARSAQDLGDFGADADYGVGFLRVDLAMQPIGLSVTQVSNGSMVPAAQSGGQIASSRPFGKMPQLTAALQSAVSYDDFMRGFSIYNGSPVVSESELESETPAARFVNGDSAVGARRLTMLGENSWLSFSGSPPQSASAGLENDKLGFTLDPTRPAIGEWSYGLMRGATYLGIGQGSHSGLSFSDARWGERSAFFNTGASASSALLDTVPNAQFATVGFALSDHARLAVNIISESAEAFGSVYQPASATGAAIAYTLRPLDRLAVSLTTSFLDENNVLLGSRASGNLLGLGPSASSASLGVGSNLDLGAGYQLGFDIAYATTEAMDNGESFIGRTSRLSSRSFSLVFAKDNLTGVGDMLNIAITKPLRIYSGSAIVNVPIGTDDNSKPIIETSHVSLVPPGNETDVAVAYDRPLSPHLSASLKLGQRFDADNVAGAQDTAAMARIRLDF